MGECILNVDIRIGTTKLDEDIIKLADIEEKLEELKNINYLMPLTLTEEEALRFKEKMDDYMMDFIKQNGYLRCTIWTN